MENWRFRIVSRLTDARLEQAGPLIPGAWSRHDDELSREVLGEFLIDTGAYGAMIDLAVAESLQLNSLGERKIHGIHGYGLATCFLGRVSLPAFDADGSRTIFTTTMECVGVPALSEKSREHDVEVIGILGRLFLRHTRLVIDGPGGRVELLMDPSMGADEK